MLKHVTQASFQIWCLMTRLNYRYDGISIWARRKLIQMLQASFYIVICALDGRELV